MNTQDLQAPPKLQSRMERKRTLRSNKLKNAGKYRTRKLALENLEARKVLTAEIFGTLYEDLDQSGTRTGGENGLSGWTVFLDLNRNDSLDAGEPSAITNVDGDYSISGIAAGNYRVAEVLKPGWTPTSPVSKDVSVLDKQKTRADFFEFGGGDIVGTVWNDQTENGVQDASEPGLEGWTIFLDTNSNTVLDPGEPLTVTDGDGHYAFHGLAEGDYEVTEVLPTGWNPSDVAGSDWKQTVAVKALQVSTQNFANVSSTNGGIRGTVFNDLNADSIRNIDETTGEFLEPGLSGWTVFVDLNANNMLDDSDISTTTNADGEYLFLSLDAGDYEVIEQLPPGWDISPAMDVKQTVAVAGGVISTADDFGNFTVLNGSISGTIWNDLNRNGARDFNSLTGLFTEPGLAGWQVFVDLNRNGIADVGEPLSVTDANGDYSFLDLQVGDYEVQEVLPTGWEVSAAFSDSNTVTVYSGSNSVAPDFANFDASASAPGSVSGVVWNDLNSNGIREASDLGLSGWTVFLDKNSDGLLTVGEPQVSTPTDGSYTFAGVSAGTVNIGVIPLTGWFGTQPTSNSRSITLRGGQNLTGLDFGRAQLKDSSISGSVFADTNKNGVRDPGEHGLAGITVYIDSNNNNTLDPTEPSVVTSIDEFYTPTVDEAGSYSFTHLVQGNYVVRTIVPAVLSATPVSELTHTVNIVSAENRTGVNTAAVYRPTEIHGIKFDDLNGDHIRDVGEPTIPDATIFVDLNRNNILDAGEPTTQTLSDGSYTFTGLATGAYVVREVVSAGYNQTAPTTVGGILWPTGTSNSAVGNVTPSSITTSLAKGEKYTGSVSITLPNSGALTNLVDVFLLFDDTGSFVNNSPIVRAAFPDIISQLNTSLPGIDLGFGVGRFEEYANFASEYSTGRPFVLNQPILAASSPGYLTSIQAALNRTTPGYGGDQPETDIEALYQLVTGKGFDGNNNGSVLDSGPAGLASTQINPGSSGDVPSFASFTSDPANSVMPAAGNVGGAGFRSGALPIVLLATDTGFAYQPKGESTITGAGGVTLPIGALTQTSRSTTPFNSGAGIQETITGLNALGALVIGLGTNAAANVDPRQQLESISTLTGTVNRTTTTIANGTADAIAPGDPLYFQIASGFSSSVANGVVSAIKNAVTNVAVDIELRASDPRVHLTSLPGIRTGVGAGMTASFNIEITGDGAPRRFDLQFVRAGTNVVLGSIPVVLGTPVVGDGYHFDELEDGEIEVEDDFGDHISSTTTVNMAPSFVKGGDQVVVEDAATSQIAGWATAISPGSPAESAQVLNFVVSNDNPSLFSTPPSISATGTLSFTPAANANGVAIVSVMLHDNGGTANGGVDTSDPQTFTISVTPVNDAPVASDDAYTTSEGTSLLVSLPGVLGNDSDIDSPVLTAVLVSGPTHGAITFNSNGSFSYVPNANFSGTDSFTYRANDGLLDSNTGKVSITVSAVNDAPVAVDDTYTTSEDSVLVIAAGGVLGNDSDVDSPTLTSLLVSGPAHGTVTLNSNGTFTYTPSLNFNGVDSFTYKASDGSLDSNVATVHLTITPVNDAPVASDDSYSISQSAVLSIAAPGVLQNDSDVDGDALTATIVAAPMHGSVTLNANGSFNYTSAAGFVGTDSFTYRANDGTVDSNLATVSIAVRASAGATKFLVVDGSTLKDYKYDANGNATGQENLHRDNELPRGIASSKDGTTRWVVDADGVVFVYNSSGVRLGSWKTIGIDKPEGITTNGTDIWIVDQEKDLVYFFAGAATRRSGSKTPTSTFALAASNRNPTDLVTDGTHIWVVNNSTTDRVFRYSKAGVLEGSWSIDSRNSSPTGITIDPNELTSLWIVDSSSDSVYRYNAATAKTSGSLKASSVFALAVANANPQGIADPPEGSQWTNLLHVADVNDDGVVSPLDALTVINSLNNRSSSGALGVKRFEDGFLDVNHDNQLSPLDALLVINELNRVRAGSETTSAVDLALSNMYAPDANSDEDENQFDWYELGDAELQSGSLN